MSLNDVLFVIAVVGLIVTTGLMYWPESSQISLEYEGKRLIEDGKTVGILRFTDEPTYMRLPIGLIPEDTKEGDKVQVTVQ